jgi:hypothetical protein
MIHQFKRLYPTDLGLHTPDFPPTFVGLRASRKRVINPVPYVLNLTP